MGDVPERRGDDRRGLIDLNLPRYLERRDRGGGRRRADQERQEVELPSWPDPNDADAEHPAEPVADQPKSLAELEAEHRALIAAMEQRLTRMRDLSDEQLQAAQVRDREAMTGCALHLRRLEQRIADLRQDASGSAGPDTQMT